MYVCICHGITDNQIREALDRGAASLSDVQAHVPVGGCCGRCLPTAQAVVEEHLTVRPARSTSCAA